MILSLAGFMGCGKSSVGREIARLSGAELIDLDSYIEKSAGRSIAEIFSAGGEAGFRKLELAALQEICAGAGASHGPMAWHEPAGQITAVASGAVRPTSCHTILSLGGGTLTTAECARIVREKTFCIYLRTSAEKLVENLKNDSEGRPMLHGSQSLEERVNELLSARESIYESNAARILDMDGETFSSAAEKILDILVGLRKEETR